MRRAAITLLLAPALGAGVAAAHADPPAPPLAAQLIACQTGSAPAQRFAAFTGSMPALHGTDRMAMSFELQRRTRGTGAFRRVAAPGLGGWARSAPGRAGFIFTKRVEQLAAPAEFRARVRFRWSAADGHVQRNATRLTPVCHEPDPRPDLQVARVVAGPPHRVTVRNAGSGFAPATEVTLSAGRSAPVTVAVPALAPRTTATVSADGPACEPGQALRVVVDPSGAIEESDEGDNALQVACRAAGAG